MNIPNILSLFRITLVPVFVVLFFLDGAVHNELLALAVLITSALTDVLDGYLARKYHQTTELGKILDPFADKLTQISVLVCLYTKNTIPLWLVLIFIVKESIMLMGGAKLIKDGFRMISSNKFGKIATALFYIVVAVIIAFPGIFKAYSTYLMMLPVVLTLTALVFYAKQYKQVIDAAKSEARPE